VKPSLRAKLERTLVRLDELNGLLAAENATRDLGQFKNLSREYAEAAGLATLYARYRQAEADAQAAQDMAGDAAMKGFADEELKGARAEMQRLEAEVQKALLPHDPNDERSIFLEVRAGTGGDESTLFAGDLLRMYTRFAEREGWPVELISESPSELGGFKEVIVRIGAQGAYSRLKFESGAHRVQRVPATEAQGRIHTSACTVAVLPEAAALDDVVLRWAAANVTCTSGPERAT
jgi:peptide chain release factor 1